MPELDIHPNFCTLPKKKGDDERTAFRDDDSVAGKHGTAAAGVIAPAPDGGKNADFSEITSESPKSFSTEDVERPLDIWVCPRYTSSVL